MEKSIAQRIKELADPDDVNDIQDLSDELFHDQSKMHYGYYYLAQAIWGD